MNFSVIPTASEGVRSHGKKEKRKRKKKKSLPQASAASSAPMSDEHDYGEATALTVEIKKKAREEGRWRFLGTEGGNYL